MSSRLSVRIPPARYAVELAKAWRIFIKLGPAMLNPTGAKWLK
jgi:hypothetical protein